MYGMLLESIAFEMTGKYGKEIWQKILQAAKVETMVFVTHKLYR